MFAIIFLALLFGFVAFLGTVLARQRRSIADLMDAMDSELGTEILPGDEGSYATDADLPSADKCAFCRGSVDCFHCGNN